MANGLKFKPRKQMNRALKPGGVRIFIIPFANHTLMLMLSGFLLQMLFLFA